MTTTINPLSFILKLKILIFLSENEKFVSENGFKFFFKFDLTEKICFSKHNMEKHWTYTISSNKFLESIQEKQYQQKIKVFHNITEVSAFIFDFL